MRCYRAKETAPPELKDLEEQLVLVKVNSPYLVLALSTSCIPQLGN